MTTAVLTPLIVVYGFGFLIWGGVTAGSFLMDRYDQQAPQWARLALATPIWPIAGLVLLARLTRKLYRAAIGQGDD